MRASYRDDAAARVDRCHRRISASHELLQQLAVSTGPAKVRAHPTKRSVATARLEFAAAAKAQELRTAALQLTEAALAAAIAVRTFLNEAVAPDRKTRREAQSYVRKLHRLAALCERTTRDATEAAIAVHPVESRTTVSGKHRG
ncbi:hypothetical protein AB0P21_36965 [Kribbella sp. NPDC056861]|uniref:hypothetical protein n=1 Tax=Kribbella sp. NPDC056861 TaxID=3154857 RepID=UPI003419646C